jgi:predicted dehydrogenase
MSNQPRNNTRSRRDFLKIPATAALASAGLETMVARMPGANDRIRVGVLGSGERGQYLMKFARRIPGVELAAVCDVYAPRRAQAVGLAGAKARDYIDHREVLDRKDIDAVLIAAPDHWHASMIADAVSAGKDVYSEKPVLHSFDEAQALLAAVGASGRVVATGTQQRSWPVFESGKRIVESGRLGRIRFIHAYWYQNAVVHVDERPDVDPAQLDWKRFLGSAPDQPFAAEKYARWRHYWDFGGGIITDLLTHWIDVVQWYMGEPAPKSVITTARL